MSDTNITEFPGDPPAEGYSKQYVDKLHSEAFRDLEKSLRDCVRMGEVVARLTFEADMKRVRENGEGSKSGNPELSFAVSHCAEMLARLEKEYDALWHGEVRGS
jgi:hypothetical protein